MRKLLKLSLVLSIMAIVIGMMGNVYALTGNVTMQTSKTELEKGQEFTANVSISNIQSDLGVVAFGATLEYDKDVLTFVKMEGQNGYGNPSYNPESGKFVMENNPTKENGVVLKITFKVNNTTKTNANIVLKDIMAADGTNDSIKVSSIQKTITIKQAVSENPEPTPTPTPTPTPGPTPEPEPEPIPTVKPNQNNTNTNTNNNSNTNTNKNTVKLPQTGDNGYDWMITVGTIFAVVSVIFLTKMIIEKRK